MKTFIAYTPTGTVRFSVICTSGCMFEARRLAMEECDRNEGWVIKGAIWM